ncbi:uncharacterized protein LOC135846470 [Planococcus citri]|uniref:uncharacterized protein LOC135846470 n=1 Tax=Planococcus citri TaxID=170843 RepID=UPI0031F894AF
MNLSFYKLSSLYVIYFAISCVAEISNDIEDLNRNNSPKPVNYLNYASNEESSFQNSEKPLVARFTYPTGATLEGYGPHVLGHGLYPQKFDIAGLFLGSMFGLCALLFIPKLIHIFIPELAAYGHYAHGATPFGKSGKNVEDLPQGVNQIVYQFDKIMSEYNINSSECMQKAICSYVQSSRSRNSRAEYLDNNNVTDNTISDSLISFLIDGSKFKSAIDNGKQHVSCSVLYPKCPFNQNSISNGIKELLLQNNMSAGSHQ